MAELLRTIRSRLRKFQAVEDAVNHHGERIDRLLDQRFNPLLPEGMKIDFLATMRAVLELLRIACDRLTLAERTLVAELSGDPEPRYDRDQTAQELSSLIIGGRDSFESMYDPVNVEKYGFPRFIGETPLDLARQGEHLTEQLGQSDLDLPSPRFPGGLPIEAMVAAIVEKTRQMRIALGDVRKEVKLAEVAQVEKDRAQAHYDRLLVWGARILEAFFRLAGEDKLARRIRPTVARPGSPPGDEDPEQAEELRGHLVAVVGDHDMAGVKGAEKRAKLLGGVAREVRVLAPLGGEPGSGYDLTDFVSERRRRGVDEAGIVRALMERVEGAGRCEAVKALIEVTTLEKEVNDTALAALALGEGDLYQRFGSLVHVVRCDGSKEKRQAILRPTGAPVIRVLPEGKLREQLADHCRFVRQGRAVHPPQWTTRAILARGEWEGIQHLEAVIEGPVVRADGGVLQEPGFDSTTGLLYVPSAEYEQVPEEPEEACVRSSLELLREVVRLPVQDRGAFRGVALGPVDTVGTVRVLGAVATQPD